MCASARGFLVTSLSGRTPRLLTSPWQCSYLWKEPSHPHPPGMPRRQRIFGVCARARRFANKVCAPHSYPPASRGREWNFKIPRSPRAGTHAGTVQRTAGGSPGSVPARGKRAGAERIFRYSAFGASVFTGSSALGSSLAGSSALASSSFFSSSFGGLGRRLSTE